MFKPKITRNNTFDSLLEKPSGNNPNQNAWLTLEKKIGINFVDSTNPLPPLTMPWPGASAGSPPRWFAVDSDNWMFPMLDWPPEWKPKFVKDFQWFGEKTWNYQFLLITPEDYEEIDFPDYKGGWMVRPNVLCLFRLRIVSPVATCTAGQTISGSLKPHTTINVVRLDRSVTTVNRTSIPADDPNKSFTKPVNKFDGHAFRSNSANYDNSDLYYPARGPGGTTASTVGHEIGHSLGEGHIMCMKSTPLPICSTKNGASATYGWDSSDPEDAKNIMGGGNKMTIVNAGPWSGAITDHTIRQFAASTHTELPPRRLSLNESYEGKSRF